MDYISLLNPIQLEISLKFSTQCNKCTHPNLFFKVLFFLHPDGLFTHLHKMLEKSKLIIIKKNCII